MYGYQHVCIMYVFMNMYGYELFIVGTNSHFKSWVITSIRLIFYFPKELLTFLCISRHLYSFQLHTMCESKDTLFSCIGLNSYIYQGGYVYVICDDEQG